MTIGDVKVTIRKGSQALDDARMSIEKANAKLAEASALAIATLHDSKGDDAQQSRKALRKAADEVELVLRRLEAAKDHAASYLAIIR
ncbi:hypothetical protein [Micromonospora parathelypteridis]|uniref:Putative translin family RNA/ssDNA-binding protein n=1 Tax=Micromonospora parathelypteridis TaxID=1839617 RepID=A0A840VS72_9ACTN|nr:hypothetical protein [Micromonospora parathelypteridis]MBB5479507.1 putative translin family RNA/ssDNA-binding protein [Micromonospora parathelypteridis]GGO30298.1 hypothetical protein GCM10011576_57680 [Micromonospora parathelypteridis]